MSDDWREFLKEVHEQSQREMERSKEREQKAYNDCDEKDYCEIKR